MVEPKVLSYGEEGEGSTGPDMDNESMTTNKDDEEKIEGDGLFEMMGNNRKRRLGEEEEDEGAETDIEIDLEEPEYKNNKTFKVNIGSGHSVSYGNQTIKKKSTGGTYSYMGISMNKELPNGGVYNYGFPASNLQGYRNAFDLIDLFIRDPRKALAIKRKLEKKAREAKQSNRNA